MTFQPAYRFFAVRTVAALSLCFILASCSERKAKEPPRTRPELILGIFDCMERCDHKAAINKIIRLKEVDKDSVFLSELESIERNNMYLQEARHSMERGDFEAAQQILAGALKRHGRIEALEKANSELLSLKKASSLIDSMNDPKSSAGLKADALQLSLIVDSNPMIASLKPYLDDKLKEAASMQSFELSLSLFDLWSDAVILSSSGNPDAASAFSQLALESPKSPAVKSHLAKAYLTMPLRKAQHIGR